MIRINIDRPDCAEDLHIDPQFVVILAGIHDSAAERGGEALEYPNRHFERLTGCELADVFVICLLALHVGVLSANLL